VRKTVISARIRNVGCSLSDLFFESRSGTAVVYLTCWSAKLDRMLATLWNADVQYPVVESK
jgi:hypothetical protein